MIKILFIFQLLFFFQTSVAETQYVSDKLSINLRRDKGIQFKIVQIIKSGTALEVLAKHSSGYTKVKTPQGKTGWVLTRFLQKEETAKDKYDKLKNHYQQLISENEKLKIDFKQVSEQLNLIKSEYQQLKQNHKSTLSENQRLLEVSAEPLKMQQANKTLREQLLHNENEMSLLKQQNSNYEQESDRNWFITGALVLLGGILLGLILPHLQSRPGRRGHYSNTIR